MYVQVRMLASWAATSEGNFRGPRADNSSLPEVISPYNVSQGGIRVQETLISSHPLGSDGSQQLPKKISTLTYIKIFSFLNVLLLYFDEKLYVLQM